MNSKTDELLIQNSLLTKHPAEDKTLLLPQTVSVFHFGLSLAVEQHLVIYMCVFSASDPQCRLIAACLNVINLLYFISTLPSPLFISAKVPVRAHVQRLTGITV